MKPSYTSKETLNRAQASAARFFDAPFGPFVSRVHPELVEKHHQTEADRQAEVSQRRAEALRLVKAAKSPTNRFPGSTGPYFCRKPYSTPKPPIELEQPSPQYAVDLRQPGTWTVIEKRDWCGEWRIRHETRPGMGAATPDQAGDRITAMLSERGARKISESCYYMACQRGGYTTFATLTLTPEARAGLQRKVLETDGELCPKGFTTLSPVIEPARAKQGPFAPAYQEERQITKANRMATIAGEFCPLHPDTSRPYTPLKAVWKLSVQKEASRFFEAANKMYTRGWQYRDAAGQTVKVSGSRALYCVQGTERDARSGAEFTRIKWWREPLSYLWVAENPDRIDEETGEYLGENPHIHLMMRWRVPRKHFDAWAKRLEKLWGHGFAHLEKIKDPQKAGSYVAKAAGYLSKAQGKTDQGLIRGNRYGISKRARAPGWIETERHQVGMMGWLLAEAHELWNQKHGPKIQAREKLKAQLDETNDPVRRQKIGKILERVRKEIEPLPRISKYGAIFKSEGQKDRYIDWAKRKGWSPEKQNSLWLSKWREQQWRRRHANRLRVGADEWAHWFAMADSGAVDCLDSECAIYDLAFNDDRLGPLLCASQLQ